jgi:GNAT superfamily N-acetyltransferase
MVARRIASPRVAPVSQYRFADLCDRLDAWRDDMPATDRSGIAERSVTGLAVFDGEDIVGGYLLESVPHANEILAMAVDPAVRRQGIGRLMCMDALFRSGKRPLVLTASDASAGFARAVGFKIVGKRRLPDGKLLTRLGWHAPRPSNAPGGGVC